jgi:hypothetical protein
MNPWERLFTEHPASVNESYFQHLVNAWRFAFRMIGSGLVCLLHGLLPFAFCSKASDTICELHERMVTNRRLLARLPLDAEPRHAARTAAVSLNGPG